MYMRRPPVVHPVAPWIGPRLHGAKAVSSFSIGENAATAAEFRIYWGKIKFRSGGDNVRSPLACHIWASVFAMPVLIEDATVHEDALTDRIAVMGVVLDQAVIERTKIAVSESGSGDLAQRALQLDECQAGRARTACLVVRRQRWWMQRPVALMPRSRGAASCHTSTWGNRGNGLPRSCPKMEGGGCYGLTTCSAIRRAQPADPPETPAKTTVP
jgi:hypothetical protein